MGTRARTCCFLILLACHAAHAEAPSEQAMAARIDELLSQRWAEEGVTPAPPASDAEFLRRAWLDLCGVLPPVNATEPVTGIRGYLADEGPDKQERLIDALLAKPTHATHFANLWRNVLLGAETDLRRLGGGVGFQNWLRGQLADNEPYDQLVRNLLLATGAANQTGPALYYAALEMKPEELAASTSRVFLGTQIQCAQCHDHPMDHWTRDDFWGYAAFFAQLQKPATRQAVATTVGDSTSGELRVPETDEVAKPQFLGGLSSPDAKDGTRRQRLANWLTAPDNPYFARAAVNRAWAIMFGRGIVEPVDDLGQHNPPSHPELLDELAEYFAHTGFDHDRLIRTLARTNAYRLSSRSQSDSAPPELFAQMAIKSLTAEQLYDCLAEATRRRAEPTNGSMYYRLNQGRQAFLTKFRAPTAGATEFQAGIPQALSLMNGAEVRQATDLQQSDILIALRAPFFTDEERVETLFLSTLSRPPDPLEREKFVSYVESGGTANDSRRALSDVLWALLNSAEFALNH